MNSKPIRLTHTSYAVFSLLDLLGEATPYELKQLLERSIENFWPIPHTTFYAEPERLARGGYLSEEQETAGRRRKRYALTDRGRAALAEWVSSPTVSAPQYRDEGILKIFAGADPDPILRQRREWHRAKLAELESCLREVRATASPAGVERSLRAGIAYHRQLLGPIERHLDDKPSGAQAATGAPPASGVETSG